MGTVGVGLVVTSGLVALVAVLCCFKMWGEMAGEA